MQLLLVFFLLFSLFVQLAAGPHLENGGIVAVFVKSDTDHQQKGKKTNLTAIFIYFTTRNYLKYYEKYFLFYWKNSFYSEDIVYSFCFTFLALLPVVYPASNCKNYKRNLLNETYFERRLSKHSKNLTFQPPHLNFEGLKEKGCNYKNWNISRRKSAF